MADLDRLMKVEDAVLRTLLKRAASSDRAANDALRHLRSRIEREIAEANKRPANPSRSEIIAYSREDGGRTTGEVVDKWWPDSTGAIRKKRMERVRWLIRSDRKRNGKPPPLIPHVDPIDSSTCTRQEWARWSLRVISREMQRARPQDIGGLVKAGAALFELVEAPVDDADEFDPVSFAKEVEELGPLLAALKLA